MTISEILNSAKRTRSNSLDHFLYRLESDFFGLSALTDYCSFDYDSIENNRVSLDELYYHNFDGIRYLGIYLVSFDNIPFVLYYAAGREGRDDYNSFIINEKSFFSAISYLESFYRRREEDIEEDIYRDIKDLDFIYGHDVSKLLFNHNFDTKFKVGDYVLLKEHTISDIKEITIRAQIVNVDNVSSINTYTLSLIDYRLLLYINKHATTKRIFKNFDVLDFSDFVGGYDSWNNLSEEQKEVTLKYLSKFENPTVKLSFKEEILLEKLS